MFEFTDYESFAKLIFKRQMERNSNDSFGLNEFEGHHSARGDASSHLESIATTVTDFYSLDH